IAVRDRTAVSRDVTSTKLRRRSSAKKLSCLPRPTSAWLVARQQGQVTEQQAGRPTASGVTRIALRDGAIGCAECIARRVVDANPGLCVTVRFAGARSGMRNHNCRVQNRSVLRLWGQIPNALDLWQDRGGANRHRGVVMAWGGGGADEA